MMRFRNLFRFLVICCLLDFFLPPAQPGLAQSADELPPPHLGYGVHIGPHTTVSPALVDQLNMDWVKLYDTIQINDYANKRILFRMDLPWPDNWESFRVSVRDRTTGLAAMGVDAIEIHNEPNLAMEWPHGPNAWEYTQMLRVAYTAIKSVDPDIIVVSGGLAPTITTSDRRAISDIEYAAEMLDNGAAQWFDAFGYHPYGYNAAPETDPTEDTLVFRRVELIRALFEERGIYNKQIWMTEFGWLRDPAEDGVNCTDSDPNFAGFAWLRVDGQTQADYTVRAFDWADRNWPWAGPMFLWNLNWALYPEGVNAMCSHMRWFSLLRSDGSLLPVFNRVSSMPRRISNYEPQMALYTEELTAEASIYCPDSVLLGEFVVGNSGYPGSFEARVEAAIPPDGPRIDILPQDVVSGERVQVYVNTTDMDIGLHPIYINVITTINGEYVSQMIQGYMVINAELGEC